MTPSQIAAVQTSFAQVVPIKDQAAALFYDRLFTIDPPARALFKGDIAEQGKKLMAALAMVVAGLKDLPAILPAVQNMARRHAGYGVQDRHYDSVGQALLWTLEQGLGAGFTPEVREAWTTAYTTLATAMMAAAKDAQKAA